MKPSRYGFLFLVVGIAGCKSTNTEPVPTPQPTGGIWMLTSFTTVTTPTNGDPPTTRASSITPNSTSLAFTDDGKFIYAITASASPTGNIYTRPGSYTFANNIVTLTFPPRYLGAPSETQKSTELTDHRLTLVETDQNSVYTAVYSR
jgi:hypothetical protein